MIKAFASLVATAANAVPAATAGTGGGNASGGSATQGAGRRSRSAGAAFHGNADNNNNNNNNNNSNNKRSRSRSASRGRGGSRSRSRSATTGQPNDKRSRSSGQQQEGNASTSHQAATSQRDGDGRRHRDEGPWCGKCHADTHETADCHVLGNYGHNAGDRKNLKRWLSSQKRCYTCFRPMYLHAGDCQSACDKCGGTHHALLCGDDDTIQPWNNYRLPAATGTPQQKK